MEPDRPRLEMEKKMDIYRQRGQEVPSRPLFSVGVPAIFGPVNKYSFGQIYLYDDMTEQDLRVEFRYRKELRRQFLEKTYGFKTRKFVTKNELRDQEWFEMAQKYGTDPDYKEIAKNWAEAHSPEATDLFLAYFWRNPDGILSEELESMIKGYQESGEGFETFAGTVKNGSVDLKEDLTEYIENHLHNVIGAAVRRRRVLIQSVTAPN